MGAGAFPANGEFRPAEIGEMLVDPKCGGLAIVWTGGEGMLGRQSILDADRGEARLICDALQHGVLLIGGAEHMAAAMDVQIDAARIVGGDDAQRNFPLWSIDL